MSEPGTYPPFFRRARRYNKPWGSHEPWKQASPRLRTLCEQQNWRCAYCGVLFWEGRRFDARATIEHFIPLAFGAGRTWHNEVAACVLCNCARGHLPAEDYYDFVCRFGRDRAAHEAKKLIARQYRSRMKPHERGEKRES